MEKSGLLSNAHTFVDGSYMQDAVLQQVLEFTEEDEH